MEICYYPGCTLKSKATKLNDEAIAIAKHLGVDMVEIPEWQCCGAELSTSPDEIASKLASVRALDYAKHHGGKLLTLCSACHNVIKRVNDAIKKDSNFSAKANTYMELDEPYNGETQVIHYLELLRDVVGFDKIKANVVKPLNRKVAAYYGCLLLRPSKVMQFDNPESPTIIEDLIRALGGTPVIYPYRNECCGAYVSFKSPDLAKQKSMNIVNSATSFGASEIVTACPLCLYNLGKNCGADANICYFTTLIMEALGIDE